MFSSWWKTPFWFVSDSLNPLSWGVGSFLTVLSTAWITVQVEKVQMYTRVLRLYCAFKPRRAGQWSPRTRNTNFPCSIFLRCCYRLCLSLGPCRTEAGLARLESPFPVWLALCFRSFTFIFQVAYKCVFVHTHAFYAVCIMLCMSWGRGRGQQEEALIFSDTSGSDLATRKRSRPPPRRIRSTALEVERETQNLVTCGSAETVRMQEHPCLGRPINQSNQFLGCTVIRPPSMPVPLIFTSPLL